ncbi:MAG TPA: glycosyltransferase family 4 protein [Gemmatimonadales bacterium]
MTYHLSRHFEGDLLTVWWERDRKAAREKYPALAALVGDFGYHPTRSTGLPALAKSVWDFLYFVGRGLGLSARKGRYDAIICYGIYSTAMAGWVVRTLTRSKLAVIVSGNPWKTFSFDDSLPARMKRGLSRSVVRFVSARADALKLQYPGQLDPLRIDPERAFVFHNFVSLNVGTPPADETGRYILFMGYPWKLKGVDVLIAAFRRIRDEFPDLRLKIVGHCPDRAPWEELRAGDERIEFHAGIPHRQALDLIAGCTMFVLPSRTEAMGRVALETMAAGRPVITSDVDGMPHYIRHGENGLLFRSEDDADLAEKMRMVLTDDALVRRLSGNGPRFVRETVSEERFADLFSDLVETLHSR